MAKIRYGGLALAGCLVLLALSACDRQGRNDMSWARAALERNDTLEVVAADQQSRTFTVRMKDTGELRVVHVDEIVASPALLAVATPQTPAPSAPPAEVSNTPPADNTAQRAPAEAGENAAVPLTQPATLAPQSAGALSSATARHKPDRPALPGSSVRMTLPGRLTEAVSRTTRSVTNGSSCSAATCATAALSISTATAPVSWNSLALRSAAATGSALVSSAPAAGACGCSAAATRSRHMRQVA